MGFDASGAIANIGNLNKSLGTMSTRLKALDAAATKFNSSGAELATVLQRIGPSGTSAAVAMRQLYSAMSNAGQIAKATGSAVGSLASKFTAADQTASKLRGNLNNVAVAGGRAAAGINKVRPGSLNAVAAQSAKAATAMDRLNASINAQRNPITPPPAPGNRGGGNSQLVLTGGAVARLAQYTLLARGIGEVSSALHFAAGSAIDFDKAIAEVRTISTEKNLDSLKKTVADLSSEFNRPLGDVAEGYYQTLSNQVGDAAESAKFLAQALKFGKVSVTDTGSAVNLLAGALHAFNRPAEDAGAFAAKFFKTIELGRVRGSELANTFGRVSTVAHQLGVSIDELDASYVTMTNKGVDAAQASTQISGAMTALLKPSKDGAKALAQLGFASGDDAVKALGFQGALKALIDTTDGSTTAIAKLVPRVRGLSFVLAATGEQAGFYKQSLEQIRNASESTLDKEYKLQIDTNAEQVTREIQRLSNYLSKDLGESLLSAANSALKFAGGADSLTTALDHLIPLAEGAGFALAGAGALYAAAKLKTLALAEATTTLGRALKFSTGAAGSVLLAYELLSYYADLKAKKDAARLKELSDSEERALDVVRKAAQDRIRVSEEENQRIAQAVGQRTAALTQAYDTQVADAKIANDKLVSETKDGFGKLIGARESFLGKLRSQLDTQKRLEESVVERINNANRQREDDQFEQGLRGKNTHAQVKSHADAAVQAAEQAKTLRSNPAATEADLKSADRRDSDAQRHLQSARSLQEREDRAVTRDQGKLDNLGERIRHGQETVDDAGDREANHLRTRSAKRDEKTARQLVQARAARKWQGEDFAGEEQLAGFNIGQRRKTGRLAELRQKQIDAGNKVGAEKLDADSDQELLGNAAARIRKAQDAGNAAQLANIRQREEQGKTDEKDALEKLNRLRELTKEYRSNISQFDHKTGKPLPPDQQADRLAKARAAGSQILALTIDSKEESKLASLQEEISKRLSDEQITRLRLAPEALDGVASQLQAALDRTTFALKAEVRFAQDSGHTPVKNGVLDSEELTDGSKASTERLADLERHRAAVEPTKAEITSYGRQAGSLAETAGFDAYRGDGVTKYINKLLGKNGKRGGLYDSFDEFDRIRKDIGLQAHGKKTLSESSIADLEKRFKRLSDPAEYGDAASLQATDNVLGHPGNYAQVSAAIEKLKQKLAAMERLRTNPAAGILGQDELARLQKDAGARANGPTPAELESIAKERAAKAKEAAKAAGDESASLERSASPAQRIAQLANWTANGYERAAIAIGKIRPLRAPDALKDPNDNFAAHGGMIRRFAFGGAVGTDTIPAMLSPGEMVMNAAASRNFYPQLTAINAGSRPPASPSSVTNNTVGDIHVTVPGGPTTAATARAMADMTRRELRRRS
ncbi:MAG TPA: phage tail tape measure protein [Pirellulales bacterium]|jgi:TP901 family phage tail tape measure protein|nr:phage tail tape measure protein [Pirellulales bacterium]